LFDFHKRGTVSSVPALAPENKRKVICGEENMSAFARQSRASGGIRWGLGTIVLLCFNLVSAQTVYRVTDLGTFGGTFGCAMSLNQKGWAEVMETTSVGNIRAGVWVDGLKIDLGTLGGPNSSENWGGINDNGVVVGFADTSTPAPNGEDFCFLGTKLICRAFHWAGGKMTELPTLGGNNGWANTVNDRGQVVGTAENTTPDPSCSPFQSVRPVIWEKRLARDLSTLPGDPDGTANAINNRGQVVGGSGSWCAGLDHAVLWDNGAVIQLPSLGGTMNNEALAINNQGQAVGHSGLSGDTAVHAVLWENKVAKDLGVLPNDAGAFATGINHKGQVVGTSYDTNGSLHAFLWEVGNMMELSTLFPVDSNLYPTMANEINSRGQISGMATVTSGKHAGEVHAFLATPDDQSDAANEGVARGQSSVRPQFAMTPEIRQMLLRKLGPSAARLVK
jgi:probable HAF family extracellular repeat protein